MIRGGRGGPLAARREQTRMGMFLRRVRAILPMQLATRPVEYCAHRGLQLRGRRMGWFIPLALVASGVMGLGASSAGAANSFVRFDYNLTLQDRSRNTVFIELFDDRPLTTNNLLQYVNGGHFDGLLMHRLARNFVLQGGGFYPVLQPEPPPVNVSLDPNARVDLDGNPATSNPTVNNEFGNTPFRSNLRGTLAMAKQPGNPNSATSEFFFNIANNGGTSPNGLDFQNGGFTVFAQVVGDGMSLIDAFNGLTIVNLNPDINDDGNREVGPFFNSPTDGVPVLGNNLLIVQNADQIDYLGNGVSTTVPAGGLTFSTRDAFIDTGTVFSGASDALTIGAGRTLGIREGYSLNRSLINHGTLAPGLQLGAITVQSSYYQFADGALDIQLRETTADTEHDKLVVTSGAFLGGKLDVSLLSGFEPAAGDSFTVLAASSLTGNFNSVELPLLNSGLVWNYARTTTSVTLSVAAADFNRNGVADAGDYIIWRNTRNTSVPTAYSGADANGDSFINDADLTIWRNNVGNTSGSAPGAGAGSLGGAAVPEPAGALLLLAGGLTLATRQGFCSGRRRPKTR